MSSDYIAKRQQSRRMNVVRRRFFARELIIQLKSQPCADCKLPYHHCQMDFWHKQQNGVPLARLLLKSKDRIILEVQKCDLLCANCSRLRTWKFERQQRSSDT